MTAWKLCDNVEDVARTDEPTENLKGSRITSFSEHQIDFD